MMAGDDRISSWSAPLGPGLEDEAAEDFSVALGQVAAPDDVAREAGMIEPSVTEDWIARQQRLWNGAVEAWNAAVLSYLGNGERPEIAGHGAFMPPPGFPGFPKDLSADDRRAAVLAILGLTR